MHGPFGRRLDIWDALTALVGIALICALALSSCGCAHVPQGPAHTRGALDPEKVEKLASRCYTIDGHDIYVYGVECPDRMTIATEWALWLTRMRLEDPKLLTGWKTVFVGERIWGGGIPEPGTRNGTTRPKLHASFVNVNHTALSIRIRPFRLEHRPLGWETWGHELCHQALLAAGTRGWHWFEPVWNGKEYRWVMDPREKWLYGVCENAGSDEPRLKHPLTGGRYP